jgi:riboflavin kinase/FMN adenylyltransferase
LGIPLVAVTFDPHPTAIVAPHCKSKLLMTLPQRLDTLASAGVDLSWVVPFNDDVAKLAPLTFLSELHRTLTPVELYVGCGFRFGNGRYGSLDGLEDWSREVGCKCYSHILESYENDNISSTRIRRALDFGEVELASVLLGRPYSLTGNITVVADTRHDGFVFDLSWEQEQLLREGVYVTEASGTLIGSSCLLGVTTVSKWSNLCGTHCADTKVVTNVLDFVGCAFGHRAELHFLHRLRDVHELNDNSVVTMQSMRDTAQATDWYLKHKNYANLYK